MAILKCKMCGGNLEVQEGITVCECEYCGSMQTVPNVDDEKKFNLFTRANRLRSACEFDKAAGVYETIVADFQEEAEAYWGLLLCKYGIEYVDDPKTGKKIPTCHRSSFDSIFEDTNFEMVMECSDSISRGIYREEAKTIENLRVGIIEVSSKEEPYDIFICYKETDSNGDRTTDSVMAQDVYDALTEKGYKVFFSRITLEDKLGQEYEPYIFSALNSSKIMLAFGTDYEHYNAVWVKNEWSRFLGLIEAGQKKTLIPCYKNIDAYDMPAEFKKLQAQDMGKVGAIQDLLRGIDKLMGRTDPKETNAVGVSGQTQSVVIQQVMNGSNVEALIQRGIDALEDEEYQNATSYFDQVLNMDAKNPEAFLGLYMAEKKVKSRQILKEQYESGKFSPDNKSLQRALSYSNGELKSWLEEIEQNRVARIESLKKNREEEKRERILTKNSAIAEFVSLTSDHGNIELNDQEKKARESLEYEYECAKNEYESAKNMYEVDKGHDEVIRIESEIEEKNRTIAGLGVFKVKEKKELNNQVAGLRETLAQINKRLDSMKENVEDFKKIEEQKKSKLNKFINEIIEERIKTPLNIILTYLGGQNWIMLDRKGTQILLIAEVPEEDSFYCHGQTESTWEKSRARFKLNSSYYTTYFSTSEQEATVTTTVINTNSTVYGTDGGQNTLDDVFLLSVEEAKRYFPTDDERKLDASKFIFTSKEDWWLRTPGKSAGYVAYVDAKGIIHEEGDIGWPQGSGVPSITKVQKAVRPAMWIDVAKLHYDEKSKL
ncbi:MAG: DUF6273 domain-containing protein [Lachnospiraceae bacterium]|nr:DUF6273 domain-containing protein [Lachnospiraceae bacterium]